jgi:hypothetical protein
MTAAVELVGTTTRGTSIQNDALAITASHIVGNSCSGSPGWRVPLDRSHLGAAPPVDDSYMWAKRHGGEEVSGTHVTLTLQGLADDTVTVTDIRANVMNKKVAVKGTYVVLYGECGGVADKRFLVAKLDDFPPQIYSGTEALTADERQTVIQAGSRFFDTQTVKLAKTETEVFEIFVYAHNFDYDWRLAVHWIGPDGQQHITNIDDDGGKPFVTVPRPGGQSLASVPGSGGTTSWHQYEVGYGD